MNFSLHERERERDRTIRERDDFFALSVDDMSLISLFRPIVPFVHLFTWINHLAFARVDL